MPETTAYRDRADITEVLLRYATGIDRRDWDTFRTVFTTDCVLDYGEIGSFTGLDAVTDYMDEVHALAGHTMHRLSNIVIALDGDRATARTYVDGLILAPDNASGVSAVGIYDDELLRTDQGWRIARRVFTAVRITTVGG